MTTLLCRLIREEHGGEVLEYAILAVGITTAIIDPSWFIAGFNQLLEILRLFAAYLLALL